MPARDENHNGVTRQQRSLAFESERNPKTLEKGRET